jgi:streptogramin lyase
VSELNTLADIVAACVNSAGGIAKDGSVCGSLFQYTTASGGSAPTDTVGAALNIAKSPGSNVASLLALTPLQAPFQPTLSSANDFTVSIHYKTAGISSPSAAAVDGGGNVWVTNAGNNTVTVLSASGAPVAGSPFSGGGLSSPSAIAIDPSGNGWITDAGSSMLSVFTPTGSGVQTAVTGLASPSGVAMDSQGLLWITNAGNSTVTQVTTSGITATTMGSYGAGGIYAPVAVAISPY